MWFIFPLLTQAQVIQVRNWNIEGGKGIHFETELSWQQIKDKAKNENKYIFVDCFASWCEPCRFMDKNVYSKEIVGSYLDAHFIAVKVQMDTTKLDKQEIQDWYPDAHNIQQNYNVTSFPTYLFFSPEGRIVHRGSGAQGADDFIMLANNAYNPDRQYYTLLEKYRSGNIGIKSLPYLARTARSMKEKKLANSVARFYFENYLFKLSEEELCSKKNIEFISEFEEVLGSRDKCFDLFYRYGDRTDSIVNSKGLSQSVADFIITSEEITPILEKAFSDNSDPEWSKMRRGIKDKYGLNYADRNVLSAKVSFFEHQGNWRKHIANFVKQVDEYGVGNSLADFYLNNDAWYIFEHSARRNELNRALAWSERAIQISDKPNAGYLDTKANLLYKLGKRKKAIVIEEVAVKLSPQELESAIKENFEKMKKGIPTWPSK